LDGGAGNDTLYGGTGSAAFVWGTGSGNDTIYTSSYGNGKGQYTIQFGEGVTQSDLQFEKNNNDLVFKNMQTQETITISNWMLGDQYKVKNLTFDDGTTLTASDLDKKIQMLKDASLEFYAPLATDQFNSFIQDQSNKLVIASIGGSQSKASNLLNMK
jgi:Ca2+-binding RTX toxin-like protein